MDSDRPVFTVRGVRSWIAMLLLGAEVLNYTDRQTLSSLAPTIQRDLPMDDRAYANIVNIYLVPTRSLTSSPDALAADGVHPDAAGNRALAGAALTALDPLVL